MKNIILFLIILISTNVWAGKITIGGTPPQVGGDLIILDNEGNESNIGTFFSGQESGIILNQNQLNNYSKLRMHNQDDATEANRHFDIYFGADGNTKGYTLMKTSGNFGINDTSPESKLDVNGGIRADLLTSDPCGGATFPEGTMFYNNTSNYYCFCDQAGADVQMHSPATACF